jgi:hypothetical protein
MRRCGRVMGTNGPTAHATSDVNIAALCNARAVQIIQCAAHRQLIMLLNWSATATANIMILCMQCQLSALVN